MDCSVTKRSPPIYFIENRQHGVTAVWPGLLDELVKCAKIDCFIGTLFDKALQTVTYERLLDCDRFDPKAFMDRPIKSYDCLFVQDPTQLSDLVADSLTSCTSLCGPSLLSHLVSLPSS
jgi:hypothetical protein